MNEPDTGYNTDYDNEPEVDQPGELDEEDFEDE